MFAVKIKSLGIAGVSGHGWMQGYRVRSGGAREVWCLLKANGRLVRKFDSTLRLGLS